MRERVPARPPPHDGRVYDTVKTLEDVESSASSSVIARAISLRGLCALVVEEGRIDMK